MCLAPLGRFPPLLGLLSAVAGGNPGSSWALGSARPRAACRRAADGDPALAPAAAAARHGRLRAPACGGTGGDMSVRQGRLSRWSRSCLAARPPLRPIQVSPSARLPAGREPRASAASWRSVPGPASRGGVPGLPRGSGGALAAAAPGSELVSVAAPGCP